MSRGSIDKIARADLNVRGVIGYGRGWCMLVMVPGWAVTVLKYLNISNCRVVYSYSNLLYRYASNHEFH